MEEVNKQEKEDESGTEKDDGDDVRVQLCSGLGHVRWSNCCYYVDDRFGRPRACKRMCETVSGVLGLTVCSPECRPNL